MCAQASQLAILSEDLGSVAAFTHRTGKAIRFNAYGPFGEPSAGHIGRMGWAGALTLPEIGMVHLRARAYAPNLGRFIQPDPIGTAGGINLYAYAGGDPVNGIDPLGLMSSERPEDCVPPLCYVWRGKHFPPAPETANENAFDLRKLFISISPPPTVPLFSDYFPDEDQAPTCQNGGVGPGCTVTQIIVVTAVAGLPTGPAGALAIRGTRVAWGELRQALGMSGIGRNPFAGKNADEIANMLQEAGFIPKGKNPWSGRWQFVNPKTGRGFHLDLWYPAPKPPHVGVMRPKSIPDYPLDACVQGGRKFGAI